MEIKFIVHSLIVKGTEIVFCWVPSHIGIFGNDCADRLAKVGSTGENNTEVVSIPLSVNEIKTLFRRVTWNQFTTNTRVTGTYLHFHGARNLSSLLCRLTLNAWRTKYVKEVKCVCTKSISLSHLFFDCVYMTDILGECALQRTDDNNNEKLIFELFHSNDHILIRKILDRIRDSLLYNFL